MRNAYILITLLIFSFSFSQEYRFNGGEMIYKLTDNNQWTFKDVKANDFKVFVNYPKRAIVFYYYVKIYNSSEKMEIVDVYEILNQKKYKNLKFYETKNKEGFSLWQFNEDDLQTLIIYEKCDENFKNCMIRRDLKSLE
ncbi:hypothetical protein J3D55_004184 [Chryseobacterium ginsenosidimutans]|uniref:hypothetical protein n=1 Tax=Chryseobacterium ginsenosidimutans TaxID=687846 RepID=UPI002168161F|nr:hypothetical protein [Chryseobacterium ginsenosidimutans]MCS3871268.1 hypothetical protein [Chryseobacterium ginsenosidimutans]